MISPEVFHWAVIGWIAIAVAIFPFLFKTVAPFGRHTHERMGPMISNRAGWILMESPAIWWFSWLFLAGPVIKNPVTWLAFIMWMVHYANRVLLFPFRTRTKGKLMPVAIVASAFFFQLTNGFFVGYALTWIDNPGNNDLYGWNVVTGFGLFALGFFINQWSDHILINLRKPGETGYKIPRGFLFEYVSCPNFFGEILEWIGFAVVCWNFAGLSFALWTIANLVPRAWAHHQWYVKTFSDYPDNRKIVIPFLY